MTAERIAEIRERIAESGKRDFQADRCGHNYHVSKCPHHLCHSRTNLADLMEALNALEAAQKRIAELETENAAQKETDRDIRLTGR